MKQIEFNKKEIIISLILSVILLFPLAIGYGVGTPVKTIWTVQYVVQLGVALIWLFVKWGLFANSNGLVRLNNQRKEIKNKKLGVKEKQTKSPNKEKNYSGIILMMTIGVIEVIIYFII